MNEITPCRHCHHAPELLSVPGAGYRYACANLQCWFVGLGEIKWVMDLGEAKSWWNANNEPS